LSEENEDEASLNMSEEELDDGEFEEDGEEE
jgi:hypothetical protein